MASSFRPRISQAKDFFPIVRGHLVAAASLHSLSTGLSLDLLPIVEDGLAGYEVLPNRPTQTYLTIGWDARGTPVVRESTYLEGPPSGLRVVAVDGEPAPGDPGAMRHRLRQRDSEFPDWPTAAEALWSELTRAFPQEPRHAIELHDLRLEELDEALGVAYRHLAECDPQIDFCGVPDEAQYGFALTDASGGRGQLAARHPGTWSLWFQSGTVNVREEWPMLPGSNDAARVWVSASTAALSEPSGAFAPALAAASSRSARRDHGGDRRHGDRRSGDRRHEARPYDDRRQGERRREDRRHTRPDITPRS